MFGPGGSFFVWVGGMNGGRDERTVCQRGCEGVVVCREVVWHRRCAGCGWGEFFLGGVVRGLGIEAVLDRVWCFCVIFKFIFGVFWIIIIEKDGWPDWLPD